jgi:hypothetical protein
VTLWKIVEASKEYDKKEIKNRLLNLKLGHGMKAAWSCISIAFFQLIDPVDYSEPGQIYAMGCHPANWRAGGDPNASPSRRLTWLDCVV